VRLIQKRPEPPALTEYRLQPDAVWDGGSFTEVKQAIREALVKEQGALCCYCMRRIRAAAEAMGVEHWAPRDRGTRQLDWRNLLGVCYGDRYGSPRTQHCDRSKGSKEITIDPQNRAHMAKLRFPDSGRIECDDASLRRDIDEVLNLNTRNLVNQRKSAIGEFQRWVARKAGREVDSGRLRRELEKLDATSGELPPFAAALRYWLDKRLRRA
jgi:uncharacterized protein (TIGR02646 family)